MVKVSHELPNNMLHMSKEINDYEYCLPHLMDDKDDFIIIPDKQILFNVFFIISPNETHYHYIKSLYKKGYIFCEKPPVNSFPCILLIFIFKFLLSISFNKGILFHKKFG